LLVVKLCHINSSELTLNRLSLLDFNGDSEANTTNRFGTEGIMLLPNSAGSTPAMVIATNEEWVIANEPLALTK